MSATNRERLSYFFLVESIHKSDVAGVEEAYVGDAVLHHQKAFSAPAPGKSLPLRWVKACVLKDFWVEHPRATHLEPLTLLTLWLEPRVHLDRRLGKGEEAGADPHFRTFSEELSIKMFERTLQVRERHCPRWPDSESIELIELRLVRRVGRFITEGLAGINHPHRRAALLRKLFQ